MNMSVETEKARYQFLLKALGIQKKSVLSTSEEERKMLCRLLEKNETEVLFLLGVGALTCIDEILDWIDTKTSREVVLLEESLESLNAMLDEKGAERFLLHPRCSLRVKMPECTREEYLAEIAGEFASDAVECAAFGAMANNLAEYEFQLRKNASFQFFGLQEDMEYHRLVENVAKNIPAIKRASLFDKWPPIFKGRTAIVCGAGPSLGIYYSLLRNVQGEYPIIAGGSAISLLTHAGIVPDLGVAVDPNETELDRLRTLDRGMPLIFSGRLHPGVLANHPGPAIYYTSQTGGFFEKGIVEALQLNYHAEEYALFQSTTIASMCLEVGCKLGCDTLVLIGFDLAFSGGERYPKEVPESFGETEMPHIRSHLKRIKDINRHGREVETTVLWKMERDALGRLVQQRKKQKFLSLPHEGLVVPGVVMRESLPSPGRPFRALLAETIQHHLHSHASSIDAFLEQIKKSLKASGQIIEQILLEIERETPRYPRIDVLFMDLHEEQAYEVFLQSTLATIERLVSRKIYDFKSLKNKCLYIVSLINQYLDILNKAEPLVE